MRQDSWRAFFRHETKLQHFADAYRAPLGNYTAHKNLNLTKTLIAKRFAAQQACGAIVPAMWRFRRTLATPFHASAGMESVRLSTICPRTVARLGAREWGGGSGSVGMSPTNELPRAMPHAIVGRPSINAVSGGR
jgi:hypothetical protein